VPAREVRWTRTATRDLNAIVSWIAEDSLDNALAVLDRLEARAHTLSAQAERGRIVPELRAADVYHYHELIERPWRLVYRIEPDAVLVMDGLDGRVARMTNTQSAFGAEYDSLADMASFGLAPALVMYEWSLNSLVDVSYVLGKLGWLGAFLFAACGALRLARFNVRASNTDKRYFQGLPSPAAAALVIGFVWACHDNGIAGETVNLVSLPLIVFAGLLMVSNISFYSFKDIGFHNKVPFFAMLIVLMVFVFGAIDPPITLFGCFLLYALSGPVISVLRRFRKRGVVDQDNKSGN